MVESMPPRADDVASLIEQVGRTVYGDAFSAGLNPAQWAALRYFASANRFSRTVSDFAAHHGSTKGTASQTVKALVRKGLLARHPDPRDRRSARIDLLHAGRDLLDHDPLARIAASIGRLTDVSRATLTDALGQMLDDLLASHDRHRTGRCADCRHLEPARCCAAGNLDVTAHVCRLLDETLGDHELQEFCRNYQS
jgi:DNA-binding MarR family transcriptional regulator